MLEKPNSRLRLGGCAIELVFGIVGMFLGLLFAAPSWGYYAAVSDAVGMSVLYCSAGFVFGIICGAAIPRRVARRNDENRSDARGKDSD